MTAPADLVCKFFDAVSTGSAGPSAALRTYLSPDVVWENSGIPPRNGVDECVTLFEASQERLSYYTWQVIMRGLAVDGDLVLSDRVDVLVDRSGTERGRVEVMGALTVKDSKITHWRDIFNPAQLGGSTSVPAATGD
jgi:limonene-1,2-epoxide hydrolase